MAFPRQLLVWGDSLVLEKPGSVVSSGYLSAREGSADMLYSEEEKLLSSPSVLNKMPAYLYLFGITCMFLYCY